MKIQKIYWSERPLFYKSLRKSKQILPFFKTHQESQEKFWREAKKQHAWLISAEKQKIYLTIRLTEKTIYITNLLFDGIFSQRHSFFHCWKVFHVLFLKRL